MISDLLQIPLPGPPVYNEFSADGVTPREHWSEFMQGLESMGADELARRWTRAERRIRENGVTYNVYGDPLGVSRPWKLDAIPLLIAADEWRVIEAGVTQRAQLLNLVLEDLYGPQNLIFKGGLPAPLLFANPAFLRPLTNCPVPKQTYLQLLAVDLARSPNGQWWVLSDRTQAPSGSGYAVENRTIVSEVLPNQFRAANVRRLAPFFRAEREALVRLAKSDNPKLVLLTPGPFNETYFEHSYLSRYLGITLVEGADLTVRDRRVFLKTVEGLRPVDVILRRVDDSFCDPLELRSDSYLGIPGLVDAITAGNVAVTNALGSGLIETAAILPFLPGLSRQLLGEPLKLQSVATWWCGQEYALEWVLEHLNQVVVKPAFPSRGMEPVFGAGLARAEQVRLTEKLRARPHEYVAQEQVALSTAPVWDNGGLHSRSMVLRTYVLNTGNGWVVMPGGLVRVAGSEGPVVSMQQGGHSKDAWVLSDGPVDTFSMLRPRTQTVELRHGSTDLPSRVADNLFWLGRYAERAEGLARLLRSVMSRVRRAGPAELGCLVRLHGCLESSDSTLPEDRTPTALDLEREAVALMVNRKRFDSLFSTLNEVQRVGSNVRERLSGDMMRLLRQLPDSIRIEDYIPFVEYPDLLTTCLELLSALSGMERENITRGPGWLFMSLGRRLERAMYSVRQMREVAAPIDEDSWQLLDFILEVADSSMTYRSRYFTTLQPVAVLDVLMADGTNPRSLDFQLSHLADLYGKLPRHMRGDLEAVQHALQLLRAVNLEEIEFPLPGGVQAPEALERRLELLQLLELLEEFLPSWSDNISNTYFSHAQTFAVSIGE